MSTNERFDQLESLLADLARKVDRQGEQIAQIIAELTRLGEAVFQQGKLLTIVSEQADGIIDFLKLSAARHDEAERRQDAMLVEIQRQGQRQDASVEALRALLKRQETTDLRLDSAVQTQLQMLQLMRADADKIDSHEPRLKRLEDEVFRAAS